MYNGWCLQDIRTATNNGGHCLFPNEITDATGATAKTVTLTAADFETLKGLWTAEGTADGDYDTPGVPNDKQGAVYYTELVTDGAVGTLEVGNDLTDPVRSAYELTEFHCADVTAGKMLCYKYQPLDDETSWTDGYPRFEKTMRVQTYLISGIGIKEDYAFSIGESILTGASMLVVAGSAVAALVTTLF